MQRDALLEVNRPLDVLDAVVGLDPKAVRPSFERFEEDLVCGPTRFLAVGSGASRGG